MTVPCDIMIEIEIKSCPRERKRKASHKCHIFFVQRRMSKNSLLKRRCSVWLTLPLQQRHRKNRKNVKGRLFFKGIADFELWFNSKRTFCWVLIQTQVYSSFLHVFIYFIFKAVFIETLLCAKHSSRFWLNKDEILRTFAEFEKQTTEGPKQFLR